MQMRSAALPPDKKILYARTGMHELAFNHALSGAVMYIYIYVCNEVRV